MIHYKTYNKLNLETAKGLLTIEGPITANKLANYQFHHDLIAFRPSEQQHKALIGIAELIEGRIIVAVKKELIVGYVTFHYPDPLERWSEGKMENLIELGAIEVIPEYRGLSIGKSLIKLAMMDDSMENYIIISTEYYWHWDLEGTGLDVWRYRKLMEKMMSAGGLEWHGTDDPEICSHPANCLMARIGKRVDHDSIERFDRLRYKNRLII